ncbi:MAG: M20/M25/M40 family metallo-hydrolase [Bacteroidales bacterium]|jgi:putative aminopeptidase FrvX|nr:M20/M25/M40 family metallo-hydrolase [Bacteroidales bacterium]
MNDYSLLEQLCTIHAPSGNESALSAYIIDYVKTHSHTWEQQPRIFSGDGFQDTVVLVFGNPKTAVYAHIDSIGFMAGYGNELVPIGSPRFTMQTQLTGVDSQSEICCTAIADDEGNFSYEFSRAIERGTTLCYKPNFKVENDCIISPFLDNRAGVFCALQIAETAQNCAIAFSTYEEHKGGSVQFLQRFLSGTFTLHQALIADITWVTRGIEAGKGCVLSLKDSLVPRKSFTDKIQAIAHATGINLQLEVEHSGGSDGGCLQASPYAIDWAFVGAPQEGSHSPQEKLHCRDLQAMIDLYKILLNEL